MSPALVKLWLGGVLYTCVLHRNFVVLLGNVDPVALPDLLLLDAHVGNNEVIGSVDASMGKGGVAWVQASAQR